MLSRASAAAAGILLCSGTAALGQSLGGTVTFIPIATNAYGSNDLNSVGISRNNLATVGNFQYTAFYQYNSKTSGTIVVGRRNVSGGAWTLVNLGSNYTVSNSGDSVVGGTIDDHDVVAMAVDGNGEMHLSWGMHNIPLNYAITNNNVASGTFAPSFVTQTATNNPALFSPFTNSGVSQATYPEFYYIPNSSGRPSGNLLFDIRDAASASGGGSGNGNTYFGVYNASTSSYVNPTEVLNGGQTSVNGYQNLLTYDHAGNVQMTWTWRSTPNFQSNNNILFAQSPTNGVSWFQRGGTTQYTLPIISDLSAGGSASQVAQVAEAISQNSSLINTTGMTVDANNNPIIATWWTPNGNASQAVSGTNNPNRQYMLVYYTGTQWKTSQVSTRTTDTAFDTGGGDVRDLGRPLVVVDNSGRVLVVTRSDSTMGGFTNASASGNNIVVYWNTVTSLDSASPAPWQTISLDTANMGEWEPSFDQNLWGASNTLDLFYEPSGLSGQTQATAQVLQWNEPAYFASATPSTLYWNPAGGSGAQDGSGIWDTTHTNFTNFIANYAWSNSFSTNAIFGVNNGSAGVVTLGANISAQTITFNASGSGNYNIAGGGYTLTLLSNPTITTNASGTISANISATGTLTKTGAGTLTLSGINTLGSTLVIGTGVTNRGNADGALRITSAAALGGVTGISMPDGNGSYSILQLYSTSTGFTLATPTITMAGNPSASAANTIENVAGNNTLSSALAVTVGGNQWDFTSDAGLFTVTSNFNLGALSSTRYLNLQGAGNGKWTGVIGNGTGGGTLALNKSGAGTWTLAGKNTYTGATTITGGKLVVAAGGAAVTPSIAVVAGAGLLVNGSISASTDITDAGSVVFDSSNGSTLNGITLDSLTLSPGGVAAVATASSHAARSLLVLNSLVISGNSNTWSGQLDLGGNDLIVHGGNLDQITNQVRSGYGSGASWSGQGIVSSAAASDSTGITTLGVIFNATGATPLFSTFDGQTAVASDVLVKYSYFGDANLDGTVDGSDYTLIDNGYNNGLTGWHNGDFNYDGVINGSDYTLIDNAFNNQGSALIAASTAQVAEGASVPEPVSGVAMLCAAGILPMRRRHRALTNP